MEQDLYPIVARIDERTKSILHRLDSINGKIEEHDKRLRKLEETAERHKSYFKVVGGSLATVFAGLASFIFRWK